MKRIAMILALVLSLSTAALAEAPGSAVDDFLSNLSDTWDSFLRMTEEAGQSVSEWAEQSGVKAWVDGAVSDVSTWIEGSGLSEWATDALAQINSWVDESGIRAWAEQASGELQVFIEQNGPAIEAWLQQAGKEVADAWNTLTNPKGHTETEVKAAFQTVTEALAEASRPAGQP